MSDDRERSTSRIPDFQSREDEAEFWDSHDLSDYWDEFRPTTVRVSPNLVSEHRLTVSLESGEREALDRLARERGMGPSTLARLWITERLRTERAKQPVHR